MGEYKRIRDLREDNDYTQLQLAQMLGIQRTQYRRYESGFRDIPTDLLIRLSELYHVSIDYLLGLTDNPERNQ